MDVRAGRVRVSDMAGLISVERSGWITILYSVL